MITLGIRAKPSEITFVVYNSTSRTLENVENLRIPKALAWPDSLKYVRNNILDLLREYAIDFAGLRITESNAQRRNIPRIGIEGVIQEAFASSTVKGYYCGQISNISKRIGIERTDFKKFVQGDMEFQIVENWSDLSPEEREATFTAIGACAND